MSPGKSHNPAKRLRYTLFSLLACCFAGAIVGDSTSEALLLSRYGPSFIPRMFIVNAVALFILSTGIFSSIDRTDRRKFLQRALLVHTFIVLFLRVAAGLHWDFLYIPLFSYAYGTKILFFMFFWTIANDLIDSRRAGSEFPRIAAGGTLGAIGVSLTIPGLIRIFAVENLLILWSLLNVSAALLLIPLRSQYLRVGKRPHRQERTAASSPAGLTLITLVRDEPLLRIMSALYAMVFFLMLNQHYIFYGVVKQTCSSAGEIASFLGRFNGISMLSTFILQLGISGMILRKNGSTRSLPLFPAALCVVFGVWTVMSGSCRDHPALFFGAVVFGMGMRVACFDAFFSPNFQIFFSSLPQRTRGRGKLLIEGVVKPIAMIAAGCALLGLVPLVSLRTHLILLALLSAVALLNAVHFKKAYTRMLIRHLTVLSPDDRSSFLDKLTLSGNRELLPLLAGEFERNDFEFQKFIVEIIASLGTGEAVDFLLDYLGKSEGRLRATIVKACGNFNRASVASELERCLSDNDPRIVANAVLALKQCNAEDLERLLQPLASHADCRVRANVVLSLWSISDRNRRKGFLDLLHSMLWDGTPKECSSALFVLGELEDHKTTEMLIHYCRSKLEKSSVGKLEEPQLIAALGKKNSPEVLEALLQLARLLPPSRRKSIVAVVAPMLSHIEESCWRHGVIKGNAIYRNCLVHALRKSRNVIGSEGVRVLKRIAWREVEAIEWEKKSLQVLSASRSGPMVLLFFAIREELIAIRIDTLLHIVALLDSSGVIDTIIPLVGHTDAHVRARALEVLENTGDEKMNRNVISLMEWLDTLQPHPCPHGLSVEKRERMIAATYGVSHNEWVATCAGYACGCPQGG